MTTALLGTAVLLWQLATGPVFEGGISTTGTVERVELPDTATSITGKASWFCRPGVSRCTSGFPASGAFAAAGPALRVGDWRGRIVTVTSGARSIRVTLSDWCFCGGGRVIDLYASQFQRLAPLSRGIIRVSVSWGDSGPQPTLPATETIP